MTTGEPVLTLEGVSVRFPARRDALGRVVSWLSAVDEVSFEVRPGEVLAIVGESGSGKSTLARTLVRLERPAAGRIRCGDIDIHAARGAASRELHRRIQIVFQDPFSSLDPHMRLRDVIEEGLHHERLGPAARRDRVAALLGSVGLHAGLASNFPHQLSGGQRQRVGIARALAAEPTLLVADEPVSALDGSIQGQILNLLRQLREERGLTMVFITHDLSVARYMADRIAVMQLGRLVELAPTERLFRSPAHPYTRALLSAVPRFGREGEPRIILRGEAISPIDPPRACRFASRCDRRQERCLADQPVLEPVETQEHVVACFHPVERPIPPMTAMATVG